MIAQGDIALGYDEVNEIIKKWIVDTLGDIPVVIDAPGNSDQSGVNVFLFDLMDFPPARTKSLAPLQYKLRYLVTTWGADTYEQNRMLTELVFSAYENHELDVDLSSVSAHLWSGFGVHPRPSFFIRIPIRKSLKEQIAKRVEKPVVLTSVAASTWGKVVGPGDLPIVDALVEWPDLQKTTRTDKQGMFSFACTPSGPGGGRLRVTAKGVSVDARINQPGSESKPAIIRVNFKEG